MSPQAKKKKRMERNKKWREREAGQRGERGGWFPRSSCQVCRRSCGGKCNPLRYSTRSLIYVTFWSAPYFQVFILKWQNLCRLLVGQGFEPPDTVYHPPWRLLYEGSTCQTHWFRWMKFRCVNLLMNLIRKNPWAWTYIKIRMYMKDLWVKPAESRWLTCSPSSDKFAFLFFCVLFFLLFWCHVEVHERTRKW